MLSQMKPRVVLGLDGSGRTMVLPENVEFNKRVRNAVDCCVGLGVGWDFSGLLGALDFKERALSDSYEKIFELSNSQ